MKGANYCHLHIHSDPTRHIIPDRPTVRTVKTGGPSDPLGTTRSNVANGMTIGNITLFDYNGADKADRWEQEYQRVMDPKYKKGTRNFHIPALKSPARVDASKVESTTDMTSDARPSPKVTERIYVIPRERGGPSYKDFPLVGCQPEDVLYAPVSKGYPMQDVSSFTLGPIVGEGLCLINAAFSKSVCLFHLEGGGRLDLSRKNFWRKARTPTHRIFRVNETTLSVGGTFFDTMTWLSQHESEWLPEWEKWRRSVAMASMGSFHWEGDSSPVAYRFQGRNIGFLEWKRECYIRPSYQLTPKTSVFLSLAMAMAYGNPVALVHPMARSREASYPLTRERIRALYDSPHDMCCQPFVLAGMLLGVSID